MRVIERYITLNYYINIKLFMQNSISSCYAFDGDVLLSRKLFCTFAARN